MAFACLVTLQAQQRHMESPAGIIGLLKLPEVVGTNYCKAPAPGEIELHSAPRRAAVLGWIRPARDPRSDADCYLVTLNVHRRSISRVAALPTMEYEEEEPQAAIVVEVRGPWFRIRLDHGAAWVRASTSDQYLSLERLLRRRPAYLTDVWDRTLSPNPAGVSRRSSLEWPQHPSVRFVRSRQGMGPGP